jgi:hypothetical protein
MQRVKDAIQSVTMEGTAPLHSSYASSPLSARAGLQEDRSVPVEAPGL